MSKKSSISYVQVIHIVVKSRKAGAKKYLSDAWEIRSAGIEGHMEIKPNADKSYE